MSFSEAMSTLLYQMSQVLEVPTLVCLLLLALVALFCLGSLLVELFAERRHYKVNHRAVMLRLREADYRGMHDAIRESGLLKPQVAALQRIARNMGMPDEELFAMSQVELENLDRKNRRRVNLTDTMSKIAPMLGLMGTLIPLGPGIVAMGTGDLDTLSSSIGTAFNSTIAGLVVAIVSLVVSRIRRTWYGQYHTMMQAMMSCVLEEAAIARENGEKLPCESWREVLAVGDKPARPAGAGSSARDSRKGGDDNAAA